MWKMDLMSVFDIHLVFTLPSRDSTLQYKRCVHFWKNFPCITSLGLLIVFFQSFWTFRKRITIVFENDRFDKNDLQLFFIWFSDLFWGEQGHYPLPSFCFLFCCSCNTFRLCKLLFNTLSMIFSWRQGVGAC